MAAEMKEDELAVSTSNYTDSSSFLHDILTISDYTKGQTEDKVDFAQRIAAGGEWFNDLLVGKDSTLYLRTTVCRLVIPIKRLAAATSAASFTFTKKAYTADWQLFTLAAGWDGHAGKLKPYTPESGGDFDADTIQELYDGILSSLFRVSVVSSALNPGGFGEAEIVVRHGLAKDTLATLKAAVEARFPDSKGYITYIPDTRSEPRGHTLVFQNIWSSFEIWQKGSAVTKPDVFKNKSVVKHSSKNVTVDDAEMDALSASLSVCSLSLKPSPKTAVEVSE